MMRVLIVDDEPLARAGLRAILAEDADVEVVGEAGNGADAVRLILELHPDLVLLDVQMPDLDGLGVLRAIPRDAWPAVIFVTAYDRYALQAFDMLAVDYLLKPFGDARAREAIDRARQRIRGAAAEDRSRIDAVLAQTGHLRRLAYRDGDRVAFLDVQAIDWIEAEGDYVRIHAPGATPLVRARLRDLAEQLDPAVFLRIHRSRIVNLDRVRELRPASHGEFEAVLQDGTRLKVSRTHRAELARRTGDYF
jgi:two-component system LytT family response regulator